MNKRVEKLREKSLAAVPCISAERASLLTRFYQEHPPEDYPVAIHRAMAFDYLLRNKEVTILPGELIVGERGPAPKAVSTYPEVCCHSMEDLDLLNTREKLPYLVDENTAATYKETVIPFWQGRSMREKIFAGMSRQWKACYGAGLFTEFMEQRAPGHTVADDKIYHRGFQDFKAEIATSRSKLDWQRDTRAQEKDNQLKAMEICAEAIIAYARRHADLARQLAAVETDNRRRAELEQIAENCQRVPARAPQNFWQALQAYWFVHLGVITELNTWDAFNPGRLDQHLWPFYLRDTETGQMGDEEARELLQCFWIKFNNQPAPPKVGVTAAESSTYTDFANINCGGVRPDGSDGVNPVSWMLLDIIDEMRLLQPSSNIQLSRENPDSFLRRACEIIRKGWGQPSIFNADAVVQELLNQGKSLVDARCGGTSGCVETGAFGKESYILTGYFNLPKVLEIALNNGFDPATGEQIGLQTGNPGDFSEFRQLMDAYQQQLNYFIDIKMQGNDFIEQLYARQLPSPFLSIVIDDCIKKGLDYNQGGARYNTTYVQGVGIGTVTDSLAAIRQQVFEQKKLSLDQLVRTLQDNFENQEPLRQMLVNKMPKYGNDDDRADSVMQEVFEMFKAAVDGRPNTKGGSYHINMLPTTCHVYFGSCTGATPDGRLAGRPFSEGISPVQGRDGNGPTAVVRSAAKMDHLATGGTLLNLKFTPQLLAGEDGLNHLVGLVRGYFRLNGHHVQFNVVDAITLQAAMESPEQYRNLIVRVAGYSDYFCDLTRELQQEIISRTAHGNM